MVSKKEASRMRTTLYLNVATWKALRKRAIEEGRSATGIVERLIRDFLKTKRGRR
jgi:hypothetical protein